MTIDRSRSNTFGQTMMLATPVLSSSVSEHDAARRTPAVVAPARGGDLRALASVIQQFFAAG